MDAPDERRAGEEREGEGAERPEAVREVHVASGVVPVHVLDERRAEALDDALAEPGEQQRGQDEQVGRREGAEQEPGPHRSDGDAERAAVAPARGGEPREDHRRAHRQAADDLEGPARRHAALQQREAEVLRHLHEHDGDRQRGGGVGGEGQERGVVESAEAQPRAGSADRDLLHGAKSTIVRPPAKGRRTSRQLRRDPLAGTRRR